jgi:hypothetical protein
MSAAGILGIEAAALEGDSAGDDVEAGGGPGGDGAGADARGVEGVGGADAIGAVVAVVGGGGDILVGGRSEPDGKGRVKRHRGQIRISSASSRVRGI